jgi:hypothetical protein
MPPRIHLIRHAQGFHNLTVSVFPSSRSDLSDSVQHDYSLRDALLTPKGKQQCHTLKEAFPHHKTVDIVFASPLRRTIQTAALSFGPTLARKEVPFVLVPALQEVGDIGSDTGIADTAEDLQQLIPDLFEEGELEFDLGKIDASDVKKGWNSKVSLSDRIHDRLLTLFTARLLGI